MWNSAAGLIDQATRFISELQGYQPLVGWALLGLTVLYVMFGIVRAANFIAENLCDPTDRIIVAISNWLRGLTHARVRGEAKWGALLRQRCLP